MSTRDDNGSDRPAVNATAGSRAAVPIGETPDSLGAFCFDAGEFYARQAGGGVTGPNAIVCGRLGRGKSTMVNMYLWRRGSE